jgi:5-methylthioadenosine/S-adenosylhomocysteine deaminase
MHVHETAEEITESVEKFGKRPLQRLFDLGLLSASFQCVHMTQIDSQDLIFLKATQANVIHCPESNLKLASGYCPVNTLLQQNINVALGTDGAASNNDLDMLGEMRTAALIGKSVAKSATAVSASQALRMATLNGAKALGLDQEIGTIEIGKMADIIAIDLNRVNSQPIYHPISQIVYSADRTQITDVWVAGIRLMEAQQLTTLDEPQLLRRAKKWQKRLSQG